MSDAGAGVAAGNAAVGDAGVSEAPSGGEAAAGTGAARRLPQVPGFRPLGSAASAPKQEGKALRARVPR
ncbi:DUF2252 domain-containing protein, partial [Streptomyces pseudogriseolus]